MRIKPQTRLIVTSDELLEKNSGFYMASNFEEEEISGEFLIAAPIYKELQWPVQVGEVLRVSYADSRARFECTARVLERVRRDGLDFLRMEPLTEFVRTQRRNDFRLNIELDVKLDQAWEEHGQRRVRRVSGMTIDISGGGAFVRSSIRPAIGEMLVITLPKAQFPGLPRFPCEVRWCFRNDEEKTDLKWNFGLRFVIEVKVKEKLIKQVFALQQQQQQRKQESGL